MTPNEAAITLGVRPGATEPEVLDAYLTAVTPSHPHLYEPGSPERRTAQLAFAQLTGARDVLLAETPRLVLAPAPSVQPPDYQPAAGAVTSTQPTIAAAQAYMAVHPLPEPPPLPPAPRDPSRLIGFIVLGVLVIALIMGVALAVSRDNAQQSSTSFPFTDVTPDGEPSCEDDVNDCWEWRLNFNDDCSRAMVRIGFSDTEDGETKRTTIRWITGIEADETATLHVENSTGYPEWAGIEDITCED
ncbi:hypothetical protein [Leifsonia sp. Leaf264]|uniref:hypothetical protein n=1 Tax=Leifsonia sp. Leaf264 TaxID=1736314 RepID=UPI0006F20340|nr:hypothetical protein [Leifsonia sp. Leaf264]KQO98559.1 hypothetical protein ASF30_10885 [Leifsonia sp. Leaf264]